MNNIAVGGITLPGSTAIYNGIAPTLTISSNIGDTNGVTGINKTGAGLLQLTGTNSFSGGINVTGGGFIFGGSTAPTGFGLVSAASPLTVQGTLPAPITSGPLGLGNIALSGTTSLILNAASTLLNKVSLAGPLTVDGAFGLTLNGAVNLTGDADVSRP